MTYEEALKTLDETFIGNLELKIVLSNALEKQIPKKLDLCLGGILGIVFLLYMLRELKKVKEKDGKNEDV